MEYKIGQILTSNQDVEVEDAFTGEKTTIPKGNKVMIGADNFAHHLKDQMIQPLGKDIKDNIKGYDTDGLAEMLYRYLSCHFPIDEMFEDWAEDEEEEKQRFTDEISYALQEYAGM